MTPLTGAETATRPGNIRIGISSWSSLPGFYPSGIKANDKLGWYARFFTIVEINVSFYRLVPPRTYARWIDATPDGFTFDVKAFGDLTHGRDEPASDVFAAFQSSYAPLREAGRLGAVLFQFPPRFGNTPGNQRYLRRIAEEMIGDIVVIEFRNHTWLEDVARVDTLRLLSELGLSYAVVDEPFIPHDTVPLLPHVTHDALAYLRLHGRDVAGWYRDDGRSRYDYDYTSVELHDLSVIAIALAREADQAHVLFNNNARGAGTRNALALEKRLGLDRPGQPELPLAQSRLFAEQH